MGFLPSKADSEMWMKDCGTHYEYILVYSDDLLIVSKDTQAVVTQLSQKHSLKGFIIDNSL